jgi:hypothetical protein
MAVGLLDDAVVPDQPADTDAPFRSNLVFRRLRNQLARTVKEQRLSLKAASTSAVVVPSANSAASRVISRRRLRVIPGFRLVTGPAVVGPHRTLVYGWRLR